MPPPPLLLDDVVVDELPDTLEVDEELGPEPPSPSDSSGAPRYVRLHAPDAAIPNAAVKIAKK